MLAIKESYAAEPPKFEKAVLPSNISPTQYGKSNQSSLQKKLEQKEIYEHPFAIETYLYSSLAHSIDGDTDSISFSFKGKVFKVSKNSLDMFVGVIHALLHEKGLGIVGHCELAFTSFLSRSFDRFLFMNENVPRVGFFNQMPTKVKSDGGEGIHHADFYACKFNEEGTPSFSVLVGDFKLNDGETTSQESYHETIAYCMDSVEIADAMLLL